MIENIKIENLYQHVLQVEGVKHPVTNPEKLLQVAEYIKTKFEKFGLQTFEHSFKLEEFPFKFKNIEAFSNDKNKREILITSHYDTELYAPGANDNGTGIAAMLEIARVLSETNLADNVRFISFTLEESSAARILKLRIKAKELGLIDEKYRFKTYHTMNIERHFLQMFYTGLAKGKELKEAAQEAYEECEAELTEKEKEYLYFFIEMNNEVTKKDWIGSTGLVGSYKWTNKRIRDKEILGVLNLETIGFVSNRKNSQKYPSKIMKLFPKYKVKFFRNAGNFLAIVGDRNSRKLSRLFFKNCKKKEIQLPCASLAVPFSYETIARRARDLLRSDHGPFWKKGIPALMLTDTANFRYPYYHTRADTIDKLDFDFVKKVCQATLATILDLKDTIKKSE